LADVRVGVDVGGTNTDAVVMAGQTLLGWAKTPTTADVTVGIVASVREALAQAKTASSAVRAVMLGTTSDVGALVGGFPREATLAVEVGGVRTNFRMPDLLTLGIGGGSLVRPGTGDGPPTIGPDSVGYQLPELGVVFGGNELTATDVPAAACCWSARSWMSSGGRAAVSRGGR